MKRTVKHIIFVCLLAVVFVSCNDGKSLQTYFVDNQESSNFITQDIPISMVKIDDSKFTEEQKEAYESVKRLNFLGYKADETETEVYKAELAKVKTILSDKKYNDLMEFSDKGNKITVKYVGTDDEADEVIIFGSAKELGFGIVRVLGDDMNPDKMVTLVTAMQNANVDENQVQDIMNFFK
ncbi:DUF4252 domain-containing protein [Sabulilitoribacter arenilitoris]|uniref:DUF4252 domain-containing protein n=1 Tax=Wocania arenilitoris TaxID=2044858 RepID=A0AAE3EN89_9FLAO|nr:DUF4252 domain-containing protein [Wocania arenilitoris]MCF7568546.1 DUF4252 domain-containing protein [Wocania arenilitoris]